MSKLAHSNEETMRQIELNAPLEDNPGTYICERCDGFGIVDTAFSDSDPCCPECDGEGICWPDLGDAVNDYIHDR